MGGIGTGDAHASGEDTKGHLLVLEDDLNVGRGIGRGFFNGVSADGEAELGSLWGGRYGKTDDMALG